jgi:Leucine-rich repeat (LRR) protein
LADNLMEELVPRLFQQLTRLKYLDLSGNPLDDLTPDVFRDIMVREATEPRPPVIT